MSSTRTSPVGRRLEASSSRLPTRARPPSIWRSSFSDTASRSLTSRPSTSLSSSIRVIDFSFHMVNLPHPRPPKRRRNRGHSAAYVVDNSTEADGHAKFLDQHGEEALAPGDDLGLAGHAELDPAHPRAAPHPVPGQRDLHGVDG